MCVHDTSSVKLCKTSGILFKFLYKCLRNSSHNLLKFVVASYHKKLSSYGHVNLYIMHYVERDARYDTVNENFVGLFWCRWVDASSVKLWRLITSIWHLLITDRLSVEVQTEQKRNVGTVETWNSNIVGTGKLCLFIYFVTSVVTKYKLIDSIRPEKTVFMSDFCILSFHCNMHLLHKCFANENGHQ